MSLRFLLVLVSACLVACGRPDVPPDLLRVGVPALPASWGDPYRAEGGPPAHTWDAIFDGLTRLDNDGTVLPALAERWSTTDGRTWIFHIRPGLRFSDGSPVTAPKIAATFEWLRSAQGRTSLIGGRLRELETIESPDERTLILTLANPDPIFPVRLTVVLIVEPESWQRLGPAGFAKQPIGTGPYRVVEFDERRRRALLEANPYSWRPPRTPRLEILELTDESVRNQALISGRIDLSRVGLDEVELLEARGMTILTPSASQVMAIALITEHGATPLTDLRVRQALNYAVDKQALADALLAGRGAPAGQPGSPGVRGYNSAIEPYPYDPDRARSLLAEAGYRDGFSLLIEGVIGGLPADAAIYQATAWYLGQVGVKAEFRPVPYATMVRQYLSGDFGAAQAFASPWNSALYRDVQRPMEAYSCFKPNAHFCDRALAEKLQAARRELEPQTRTQMLQALSARYHEVAPSIFLVEQIDIFGHTPRISGVRINNRVPVYEEIEVQDGQAPRR